MRVERFHDFDAFASSIAGIDSKMLLRDTTTHLWTIHHLQMDQIELQIGRLGSGNIAGGNLHDDRCLIYVPLTDSVEYSGNGNAIHSHGFFVLEPGAEFCVSTKEPHDWAGITLPTSLLPESVIDAMTRRCRTTGPNEWLSRNIRSAIQEILNTAESHPDFETTEAGSRAGETLRALALQVLMGESARPQQALHRKGRPRVSRDSIVHQALELIHGEADTHIAIPELADACGVSERTLRAAFSEYFGVGPKQYLQTRQLNAIHRKLKAASIDETSVTNILVEHGEWAHGRFAHQYQSLFGELPSETLARQN